MTKLLHVCCANCLSDCVNAFRRDGSELVLLFANPNIHPLVEYRRRLKSVRLLAARLGLRLEEDPYGLREFLEALGPRTHREDGRCRVCYRMRLVRAAQLACALGAESFSTTLLVSHQQDRDALLEVGRATSEEFGVTFESPDLRDLQGRDEARPQDLKLYRQSYCGCIFSEEERFRDTSRGW